MKLLLAALLLAGGGFLVFHLRQASARQAKELSAIASELAGRPVHVSCQNIAAAALDVTASDGSVTFDAEGHPSDTAHLKRNTCRALGRFAGDAHAGKLACLANPESCSIGIRDDAEAAHVLAHESMHLRGIQDEGLAECAALQATAWTAEQLGATANDADLVEQYAQKRLYPLMPQEYHSSTCGA